MQGASMSFEPVELYVDTDMPTQYIRKASVSSGKWLKQQLTAAVAAIAANEMGVQVWLDIRGLIHSLEETRDLRAELDDKNNKITYDDSTSGEDESDMCVCCKEEYSKTKVNKTGYSTSVYEMDA
ncbi:unnamed protein product [Acanthoscelides obtectus]|uniref:Uncharacterized protein n=1 Tax=Acanthoscelides obtectus TaxID=200917 RepID=A0A9P0PMH4_ACAOB|nr:unnamed protein product [Acanthoscelides obtectus]CAK1672459.1 hypothetical protein AOBTE_LOCUS28911 [Acanthoscelides obtectus]